jgi:hypothetical protein
MLFDIAPEEPARKKTPARRAKDVPPQAPEPEVQNSPSILGNYRTTNVGKIDGHFTCMDDSCGSQAFDIADEYRGEWFVQCAICGTGFHTPEIKGHLKPKTDGFVFNDGRFAGLTVEEAWREPRGQDYVEWAAKSHPRQAVRTACKNHLDSIHAAT